MTEVSAHGEGAIAKHRKSVATVTVCLSTSRASHMLQKGHRVYTLCRMYTAKVVINMQI